MIREYCLKLPLKILQRLFCFNAFIDGLCKKKIMQIKAGEKTAQLLLLPYLKGKTAPVNRTGGFGNTGIKGFWQMVISDERPQIKGKIKWD